MKKIILIVLFIIIQSCSTKYYGYVYDFDEEVPLENVKIYYTDALDYSISDEKGYFEITFKEKVKYLIFEKDNYQIYNLRTLSIKNGEFMEESPFGDTIYLISKNSKYKRPKLTLPYN
jgi:hypothetical protein